MNIGAKKTYEPEAEAGEGEAELTVKDNQA